jgi:hypothetical protein
VPREHSINYVPDRKYTGSQLGEAERGFDLGARVQGHGVAIQDGTQQPFKITYCIEQSVDGYLSLATIEIQAAAQEFLSTKS